MISQFLLHSLILELKASVRCDFTAITFFFFFFVFCLLGPHPQYMEVPRLGVELELRLPVYTTATATRDLS